MEININTRERIIAALNNKEPNRVPVDIGACGATTLLVPTYDNLKKYFGIKKKTRLMNRFFNMALMDEEVLNKLDINTRGIGTGPADGYKDVELENGAFIDEWGITSRKPENSIYNVFDIHPLSNAESVEDIRKYKFPDPENEGRFRGLKEKIDYLYNKTDFAIIGSGDQIFELSWYLRGAENIFTDMYFNKKLVHALMEKISDYHLAKTKKFLEIVGNYIQVFFTGDDIASQNGPLISVEMYKEFIKPYQKKVYGYVKDNTNAKIIYHSCGNIYDFLPDLIEIGVDGINPVQVWARNMDTNKLKKEFGNDLSFWGAIDTQRTLPFGTIEDLKKEVRKRIDDLGTNGGFVLGPVHAIQPDVKPEKIIEMIEYAKEYGVY